jgi:cytochrome P450
MTDTATVYNPFEPGFTDNPYPQYQALRDADPVHQSPFGIWVLFAHDDVLRFLRDSELSVDEQHANPGPVGELSPQALVEGASRCSYSMFAR